MHYHYSGTKGLNIDLTRNPDKPSEYWISDLRHTVEDKEDIEGNHTITDRHMSGIIHIITKQFPEMPPVQISLNSMKLCLLNPATDNSIFFHCFASHWVLLSHYKSCIITLSDSLQLRLQHKMMQLV